MTKNRETLRKSATKIEHVGVPMDKITKASVDKLKKEIKDSVKNDLSLFRRYFAAK